VIANKDSIHNIEPEEYRTIFLREERTQEMLQEVLSRVFHIDRKNVLKQMITNRGLNKQIGFQLSTSTNDEWYQLQFQFINGDWRTSFSMADIPSTFLELAHMLNTEILFSIYIPKTTVSAWVMINRQGVLYIGEQNTAFSKMDFKSLTRLPIMSRSDFFKELKIISSRPAMYLGCKSMTGLELFINGILLGFTYSITTMGYDIPQVNYLGGFDRWRRLRYQVKDMKSIGSILLEHLGEEEKAFDLFFEEFRRYEKMIERLHRRYLKDKDSEKGFKNGVK
jgi:hypothetical protein